VPKRSAIERFAEKCAFDPYTGCVMWVGAQTSGHGHNEPYGYFWFQGRMILAHRWSAEHIHGLAIDGLQVDHCCPHGPSTLCVQHVKPETAEVNRYLQHARPGRAFQDLATRRHWVFVQKGYLEPEPPPERFPDAEPIFVPPRWLLPFLPTYAYLLEMENDGIPF
jgi:hypothetical protein